MPDVQNTNLSKIIKRLELIKNLISLEEEDEIDSHVFKLEQIGIRPERERICSLDNSGEKEFIDLNFSS